MSTFTFVQVEKYGGIDWHDSYTKSVYLEKDGNYNLTGKNVYELIAQFINKIHPEIPIAAAYAAIVNKVDLTQPIPDENGHVEKWEEGNETLYENETKIFWKDDRLKMREDFMFGQISYVTNFYIEEVDSSDIEFVVVENFLAPRKGTPSIERMFHEPFDSIEEAIAFMDTIKLHSDKRSVKEFHIVKKSLTRESEWYKVQVEAMQLMKEKGVDEFDESFQIDAKAHIENLKHP